MNKVCRTSVWFIAMQGIPLDNMHKVFYIILSKFLNNKISNQNVVCYVTVTDQQHERIVVLRVSHVIMVRKAIGAIPTNFTQRLKIRDTWNRIVVAPVNSIGNRWLLARHIASSRRVPENMSVCGYHVGM